MDLTCLTIDSARSAVQERKTTAFALAEAYYARIQKEDGQIGAFLTLSKERALAQADRIDRMAAEGQDSAAARRSAGRDQRRDGHARRAHDCGIENSRANIFRLTTARRSRAWKRPAR